MRTVTVVMESVTPVSFSKHIGMVEKGDRETHDDFEKRTWKERCHVTGDGYLFVPPMAFKKALDIAAKRRGDKIKGKGNNTYAKSFVSGVLVMDALRLDVKKDDVPGEWLFVPSDGVPGSGKRVMKCFPVVHVWGGEVTFHVLDETITESVFENTIKDAGLLIGIGRFRPERGGFYGRFKVKSIKWN